MGYAIGFYIGGVNALCCLHYANVEIFDVTMDTLKGNGDINAKFHRFACEEKGYTAGYWKGEESGYWKGEKSGELRGVVALNGVHVDDASLSELQEGAEKEAHSVGIKRGSATAKWTVESR